MRLRRLCDPTNVTSQEYLATSEGLELREFYQWTSGGNWTCGYDDLSRLISADNAGDNTLDETYSYSLTDNCCLTVPAR